MSSALQHFCRVCNTQLNSCKQARIHVAGKKHEKRLAYLKFSLETSEAVTGSYSHAVPQPLGQFVPGPASVTSGLPTVHSVYAYPPPCGAPAYAPAPAPAEESKFVARTLIMGKPEEAKPLRRCTSTTCWRW